MDTYLVYLHYLIQKFQNTISIKGRAGLVFTQVSCYIESISLKCFSKCQKKFPNNTPNYHAHNYTGFIVMPNFLILCS